MINSDPRAGAIFLYSTSPSPHESTILQAVRRGAGCTEPIRAVALRTALEGPGQEDLAQLARHFAGDPARPVDLRDSGLDTREDASDPAVITRLEQAELVLIGGGSPTRLLDLTRGTPALAALRSAHRRGAVLAGCSAGAIAVGAGLVEASVIQPGWNWLSGRVVAPHFGRYDITPWRAAFPANPIIGIPDGAMVVVTGRDAIRSLGDPPMIILPPLAPE